MSLPIPFPSHPANTRNVQNKTCLNTIINLQTAIPSALAACLPLFPDINPPLHPSPSSTIIPPPLLRTPTLDQPPRPHDIPSPQQRRHIHIQGAIRLGTAQQHAHGAHTLQDAVRRGPGLLEQVQTYLAVGKRNVGVHNRGEEAELRRLEGVGGWDGDGEEPSPGCGVLVWFDMCFCFLPFLFPFHILFFLFLFLFPFFFCGFVLKQKEKRAFRGHEFFFFCPPLSKTLPSCGERITFFPDVQNKRSLRGRISEGTPSLSLSLFPGNTCEKKPTTKKRRYIRKKKKKN